MSFRLENVIVLEKAYKKRRFSRSIYLCEKVDFWNFKFYTVTLKSLRFKRVIVLENSVAYLVELFFNDKVFIAYSIFSSPYFFSFSLSLYKSLKYSSVGKQYCFAASSWFNLLMAL